MMNIFKLKTPTRYGRKLAGTIKTTYTLLLIVFIWAIGVLGMAVYQSFESSVSLPVSIVSYEAAVRRNNNYKLSPTKKLYRLYVKKPNIAEFIFLDQGKYKLNIINALLTIAGVFQLLRIFKALDEFQLFSFEIAKHLKILAQIFIIGFFVTGLRVAYSLYVVHHYTYGSYTLENSLMDSSFSSLFTGLILVVIAAIYKRACVLQEEQQLTV